MKAFAIVSSGVVALSLCSAPVMAQLAAHEVNDLPGPMEGLSNLQNSARMVFALADENSDGQIS